MNFYLKATLYRSNFRMDQYPFQIQNTACYKLTADNLHWQDISTSHFYLCKHEHQSGSNVAAGGTILQLDKQWFFNGLILNLTATAHASV